MQVAATPRTHPPLAAVSRIAIMSLNLVKVVTMCTSRGGEYWEGTSPARRERIWTSMRMVERAIHRHWEKCHICLAGRYIHGTADAGVEICETLCSSMFPRMFVDAIFGNTDVDDDTLRHTVIHFDIVSERAGHREGRIQSDHPVS